MFSKRIIRWVGIVLGVALLAAGVLAAMLLSSPKPRPLARVPVRPVKTMTVGEAVPATMHNYPGKVQATQRVVMSFDVPGAVESLPVIDGQKVSKSEVLARLDPRDYQNTLNARKAVEHERQVDMVRVKEARSHKVATDTEVDQAVALYEVAKAETAIAQKAVDDTVIHAPFDGVVAYTIVRQYQKVTAKEPILSVQDLSTLEVVVYVPEQVITEGPGLIDRAKIVATFDQVPGRDFPMTVKEHAMEADRATLTYRVTLQMPAPKDVSILPGMSATVNVTIPPSLQRDASESYLLPLTAVPADGHKQFYVWLVEPAQNDLYTVKRQDVTVGPMTKNEVTVTKGISRGQRVVTAGAHLLENGQLVRLLPSEKQEGRP